MSIICVRFSFFHSLQYCVAVCFSNDTNKLSIHTNTISSPVFNVNNITFDMLLIFCYSSFHRSLRSLLSHIHIHETCGVLEFYAFSVPSSSPSSSSSHFFHQNKRILWRTSIVNDCDGMFTDSSTLSFAYLRNVNVRVTPLALFAQKIINEFSVIRSICFLQHSLYQAKTNRIKSSNQHIYLIQLDTFMRLPTHIR